MRTIHDAARALAEGRTTARALVEECLARIEDPAGEGGRAFLHVYAEQARASAEAMDALRRVGRAPGPCAGIPVSLKDLLDVAGEVTRAGSRALADAPPARAHAPVVQRLLAAGFVPVGRTNMTEFAFSGIGVNPHHGTPRAPWDRETGRIPGGSSSGAAVSVADGMALAAIGTDTGGSCRIPAALCGVVGLKPTSRRVPTAGAVPLSTTLDSIGPLANSVACCAVVDAVISGDDPAGALSSAPPAALDGLRLAAPTNVVLERMDAAVGAAFECALARLAARGARIARRAFAPLDGIGPANALGGFSAPEALAWHRDLLEQREAMYDPRVRARILRGNEQGAVEYVQLLAARARLIRDMDAETAEYDALVLPTVPIVPPRLDEVAEDAAFHRLNALLLRNTSLFNFLDRCAISLPCHAPGEPPAGLMLAGETMGDRRLLAIARAVEAALA